MCLCVSFNLQECINYNTENGSNIHVAFLDSNKAFDTVWQEGLLYKIHELKGKIWILMKKMYTGVIGGVFFNGHTSPPFFIKRGIVQGGALSAKLYLIFINDLLNDIESCGYRAVIADLKVNIPTQADDICLVSTHINGLQRMISMCEDYSRKWRFTFSESKSKLVSFSRVKNICKSNDLILYNCILPYVEEITHVGILLNRKCNSMSRTERACSKIKAGVMSLVRSGAHPSALNPLTIAKLVKIKMYPSALYGCELWILTKAELIMLERAQHFVVKSIQGFDRKTMTDLCTSLLGWTSIKGYIDIESFYFLVEYLE